MKQELQTIRLVAIITLAVVFGLLAWSGILRLADRHPTRSFVITDHGDKRRTEIVNGVELKLLFVRGSDDDNRGTFYQCTVSDATYTWADYMVYIQVPLNKCKQVAP